MRHLARWIRPLAKVTFARGLLSTKASRCTIPAPTLMPTSHFCTPTRWSRTCSRWKMLFFGFVCAAKQSSGDSWWVVVPKSLSNCYFVVPVTAWGGGAPQEQCLGIAFSEADSGGQVTFAPDGTQHARIEASGFLTWTARLGRRPCTFWCCSPPPAVTAPTLGAWCARGSEGIVSGKLAQR
jgi:hypothetical protein